MIKTIEELSQIHGPSGDESRVRNYILSQVSQWETVIDNLGNLIVFKKGRKTPKNKIMIAAHMDEVGFIITHINEEGFLKFATFGGIDPRVVVGRQVSFACGKVGVIGTKAIHQQTAEERDKAPKIDDLFIDIGAISKENAEEFISLGDTAVFVSEFAPFGKGLIKGKALDDRVGCGIMLDMLNSDLEYDCYFAFTVQEEVGTRGAKTATHYIKPDYAMVLETTTACDISGVSGEKMVCQLGKGPVISYMDRATIYNRDMYDMAFKVGEENGVPCQTKTLIAGGNDSGAIHTSVGGVKTMAISLATRYLHSPSCVISSEDLSSTRKLAEKMFEKLAVI